MPSIGSIYSAHRIDNIPIFVYGISSPPSKLRNSLHLLSVWIKRHEKKSVCQNYNFYGRYGTRKSPKIGLVAFTYSHKFLKPTTLRCYDDNLTKFGTLVELLNILFLIS